ncbi:MAG: hypothetical protein LBN34_03315 [Clostridiales Family XIII bacterium]|jgi:cell division protein FtsL|nr:hypothetical protein [Clostridiales Family XIII bacterium]
MENLTASKKSNPVSDGFKKLSRRERVMIIALVIIVFVGAFIYFIALPMMSSFNSLKTEVMELQDKDFEMRTKISQTESYKDAFDQAEADYNKYTELFYKPMAVEVLDELVTGMIVQSGLVPGTLSMSELVAADEAPYTAATLGGSGTMPETADDSAVSAEAATDAATDEAAGSGEADTAEALPISGTEGGGEASEAVQQPVAEANPVYAYTVNISAEGGRELFYKLLTAVRGTASTELVSYQISDAETYSVQAASVGSEGGGSAPAVVTSKGSISMQIKIYVFAS